MAADRVGAETKIEPTFARGRHLLLAVVGLAHAPLIMTVGRVVLPSMGASAWSAEAVVVCDLVGLCYAAFVAWLAFAVFDTNAGVAVLPRRWLALGAVFAAWCVGVEVFTVVSIWRTPAEYDEAARSWLSTFAELGDVRFGWLVVAMLTAALAEEIVYRALLLRALEGYMTRARSLVVHAVVFELVHAFVYGYGLTGVWFVAGLILGHAFQRTRSLGVPTLLHAGHNILFVVLVWYFNR